MKPLHLVGWSCCAVLLAGVLGCKSDTGSTKKVRVAFVSNNPEAFWNIAEAGTIKAAKELGVECIFRKPTPGNAATRQEEIDAVVNQGVKAIAVSVIDPKNQQDYLDEIAKKVSLITQDNDAPNSKRLAYIGTNNYEAGRQAGKLVKEALGDAG